MSELSIIQARLDEIEREAQQAKEAIQSLSDRLNQARGVLDEVEVERRVLRRLLHRSQEKEGEVPRDGRPGPSEAIIELVERRPGIQPKDVVDQLENVVKSSAQDVRHVLFNTIFNLQKRETLTSDDKGRLYIFDATGNHKEAAQGDNQRAASHDRIRRRAD